MTAHAGAKAAMSSKNKGRILVLDDDRLVLATVVHGLAQAGYEVIDADNGDDAILLAREHKPELALLDIRMEGKTGFDVAEYLRDVSRIPFIFLSAFSDEGTAAKVRSLGAVAYLVKPLDLQQLKQVVEQGLQISALMKTPAAVELTETPGDTSDRLVGSSPAMQAICKQIGRVAPQDVNVLLLGESGTGKELVARAIYHHSRRHQGPFLAINCAAIPETLLESELFGHERGAFTGADTRRIGKFEQCHQGTIFLDEVGDMPPATQAKILRLLQDGQFQRVGANATLHADVRIIAATNQNIEEMIEAGRFRRDLYYRLRGVALTLPPLRERLTDIAELAYYFLFRMNRQLGTAVQTISTEALARLERHSWPGNVRELQCVIREALIVSAGSILLPEFLPLGAESDAEPEADSVTLGDWSAANFVDWQKFAKQLNEDLQQKVPDFYRRTIARLDRLVIMQAMQQAGGVQSHAADLLGLSRPTLRAKLQTLQAEAQAESVVDASLAN